MPIEQVFDTRDAVPEFLQSAAVEEDGKFIVKLESSKEVESLKNALRQEREGRSKYEKIAKRFDKLKDADDDTLDKIFEFLETGASGNDGQNDGDDKGKPGKTPQADIDRAVGRVKSRYEQQLNERDEQIKDLTAKVRDFSIWTPVRDMAGKNGVLPDRLDAFVKLMRTDGRFDLNEQGALVFKEDGYVSDRKPEKAFELLREEYPYFFAASGAAGSGATPGANGGTYQKIDYSKLSPVERINAARRLK